MIAAPSGRRRLEHLPALDGLRGLSVIAVLLFHGGVGWATGGFLGVDVFFVLSGFLITRLLLGEQRATGSIGLGRFWSRRARRLLPALLLVVAAVGAAGALFDPSAQVSLRGDALASLAYVANWRFVAAGADYFGRTAADSPLQHLWSLSIEEQFYVVWPVVVLGLARLRRVATWVGIVAGLGAAASAATMVLLHQSGDDPSRVYYGTDTRIHTVLLGAALAAAVAVREGRTEGPSAVRWPTPVRLLLGLVAAVAAVDLVAAVALAQGDQSWLYEGGLPLVSVAAAILIAHVVLLPRGAVASVLRMAPLAYVGQLSYGLYLWHWPLFLVLTGARTGLSGPALLALRLVATFAVAFASYELLEQPIRTGQLLRGWWSRLAVPVAAAAAVAAVLVGTPTVADQGGSDDEVAAAALSASSPGPTVPASPSGPPIRNRAPGAPLKVLVLGDSIGLTLAEGLVKPAAAVNIVMKQATVLGCGVVRGGPLRYVGEEQLEPAACPTWPSHWSAAVEAEDPDVALVVLGRWEVVDRFWQGRWTHLGDPEYDRYVQGELEQAVATAARKGARVALATAAYCFRGERPDGGTWPEDEPMRVDRMNQLVRTVAARQPSLVTVVDVGAKTAKDGAYTRSLDGVQLRYDGVHFTRGGARWLAPWLLPQLEALAPLPAVGGPATTAVISGRASTTSTAVVRPPTTALVRPAKP